MSAHSRSGGSPSVRQLIARYQSMDSPSSLSPRPTFSSPRPTETLPPRRGRLGFAGEDQVSVEEPKIRLSLEALNCVLCHSDISGTRVVARSPSSSSDPDTFDSSDSEEDISPGSRLPRDETSSPPDRNIRKPGRWFVPAEAHQSTDIRTGHRPHVDPVTLPSISRTSSSLRHDIDDNEIDPGSFFVPRAPTTTTSLSRGLPPLAAQANFVDASRDFSPFSQRFPLTPPHDDSDLISLSPPTNAGSTRRLSFHPTRYSTPFLHDRVSSPPDHPVEDRYLAAAKRAITLESRLPSRLLSTPFQPAQTLARRNSDPSYSPETDASFPYFSDISTPYNDNWRLKNLLRGPRRTAPPNTPSASPVRRFLQRRAEQESHLLYANYGDDQDDSPVSEAGCARPPGRLEMRDSPHSHHLAARVAETSTSILSCSLATFHTDFSPSPFPLHRQLSSFSLRDMYLGTRSLFAPPHVAELSIPEIRLPEMDESIIASLERSLIQQMETFEVQAQQGLPQALEMLWEYGSESSGEDRGGDQVLSEFPGWSQLDDYQITMLRLARKEE